MKTSLSLLFCLSVFLFVLHAEANEVRSFTNLEGKKIEAELLDMRDGSIRIRVDRRVFDVPVATLSQEDRVWLEEWNAKRGGSGGTTGKGAEEGNYYSELVFEDDFSKGSALSKAGFGERWEHLKSESIVSGGVLVGKTIDIADHAGEDSIRFNGRRDLEITLKFNFAGPEAESFNVWINDKDYDGSHAGRICSVAISPKKGSVSDAKTGNYEKSIYALQSSGGTLDEATQAMLNTKTSNFMLDIARNKWHTLLIRTKGDEATVSINGYQIGRLKSEGIAHPTKTKIGLMTTVKDVHYDDFVVRAAPPGSSVPTAE